MRIRDLMTTDVITVGPDAPLKEAALRMLEAHVSGLPVIDDEGRMLGIVTEADFVAGEANRRTRVRAGLLGLLDRHQDVSSQERLVRDVMTVPVVTIGPESDHAEAARLMQKEGVKRLPVMEGDRLVGIFSRSDTLRSFVRPDREIIDEINEYLLSRVLWVDPAKVEVRCVDGNVALHGRLDTRSDTNLLIELTKRLDGVASLVDGLGWEYDNMKVDVGGAPYGANPRSGW